ncbi:MAG: hypothetical protein AAF213_03070 [Pseudomonadota bacterium]
MTTLSDTADDKGTDLPPNPAKDGPDRTTFAWRRFARGIWQHPAFRLLLGVSFGVMLGGYLLPVLELIAAGNRPALGPALMRLAAWLSLVPLAIGVASMISKRLDGLGLMLMALVAGLVAPLITVDTGDHQPWIWLGYALIYPLLWLNIIRPARRSLARSFTLLILTVTLMTSALFHLIVVDLAYRSVVAQERGATRQELITIIDLPQELFEQQCRLRVLGCWSGPPDQAPDMGNATLQDKLAAVHEAIEAYQLYGLRRVVEPENVTALSADLRGDQLAYFHTGEEYRVAWDNRHYGHLTWRYQIYLGALMASAHLWWVFGGFILLAFHQSKTAWRYAKREADEIKAERGGIAPKVDDAAHR